MYEHVPSFPVSPDTFVPSVLSSFPASSARQVVDSVVRPVSRGLSIQVVQKKEEKEAIELNNEGQMKWFMQVVCHGLSLPLSEHDVVKDCVNIYCEWLSALMPETKACVPKPVAEEPNR